MRRVLNSVPYVEVRYIGLLEYKQGPLEVVHHVLLGAAISDVLQEVHKRLVGAPELLVQGVNLADFVQAAVLQDGRGLGRTAIDRL